VVCWGSNAFLQIGALTPGATGPIQPPLATMADLAVGANHACAVSGSGQTRCWGDGAFGQNGDIDGKPLVGQNIIAPPAADVAAGDAHSCILGQQGELWCWGDNSAGQLGRGVAAPGIHPPAPAIAVPNGLVEIVAGGGHTCARGGDGSVWCWGRNDHGQLGLGDTGDRLLPVKLASVGDVVALALGTAHSCALRQDGAVWCWGDNTAGQLGIGSAAPLWSSPQPVGPPTP
jgi:alpha-tubulin suppressor-like RCC1 family protein